MPLAPPRPCVVPTCSTLDCTEHQPHAWRTRKRPEVARIRGRQLQRLRHRLFSQQPLCVRCVARGQVSVATIRDHIIPLAEGGQDNESNVQALCQDCSDAKTADESRRGVDRARGGI